MVRPGLHHSLGKLSQEDQFKDMDFRILTISKGFNGVILPSHHKGGGSSLDISVGTPASSKWSVSEARDLPVPRVLFAEPAPDSLRVVSSCARTTSSGQYRIHLGTAVGCG